MSEENKNDAKIKNDVISNLYKIIGLVLVAGGVIAFTLLSGNRNSNTADGCRVNEYSPFGQAQQGVWVELNSYAEAYAVSYFDMEYPEKPFAEYPNDHYRAFKRMFMEVYYTDDTGSEGVRFTKGYTCNGAEVYDTDNMTFRSTVVETVGDVDVTERGDGEKISMATWYVGDYSYGILALEHPLDKDVMEALVQQLK
ncbi:MAG: hypothetical protein IKG53_06185 [Solobacterium sp.]|nr:hypothetical protein [Solobacterium sp.]